MKFFIWLCIVLWAGLALVGLAWDEDLVDIQADVDDLEEPLVMDNAFIIASQRNTKAQSTVGRNLTVVVDLYNAGRR